MSATSRALELINMGATPEQAYAWVAADREASERGEPSPPLPQKVQEYMGQVTMFAPDVWDEKEAAA